MKPPRCTLFLSIFISTSLHVSGNYVPIIRRTYCIFATLVFFTMYGWLSGLLQQTRQPPVLTYSMVQSPSWEANWFAASQEIPRISRNPKVHYRTHKCPPPLSLLGQPNPVHIPTSHLLEIRPNIIHPSKPRSPQCFFPSLFPTKTLYTPLSSPIRATWCQTCKSVQYFLSYSGFKSRPSFSMTLYYSVFLFIYLVNILQCQFSLVMAIPLPPSLMGHNPFQRKPPPPCGPK